MLDLRLHDGARPDQGHFATEDIEELRQFVQRGLAQQASERRDARVVPKFEVLAILLRAHRVVHEKLLEPRVGVRVHGAELPDFERLAVESETLRPVENRPLPGQHDQERNQHKQRRGEQEHDDSERIVQKRFLPTDRLHAPLIDHLKSADAV